MQSQKPYLVSKIRKWQKYADQPSSINNSPSLTPPSGFIPFHPILHTFSITSGCLKPFRGSSCPEDKAQLPCWRGMEAHHGQVLAPPPVQRVDWTAHTLLSCQVCSSNLSACPLNPWECSKAQFQSHPLELYTCLSYILPLPDGLGKLLLLLLLSLLWLLATTLNCESAENTVCYLLSIHCLRSGIP